LGFAYANIRAGWETFAAAYCEEILDTFVQMFSMRKYVLLENRSSVDKYLTWTWLTAYQLAKSSHGQASTNRIPAGLCTIFRKFVLEEEQRIIRNLREVEYNIDSEDAVVVVLGRRRIEKVHISQP
jgi:hypothetical protein